MPLKYDGVEYWKPKHYKQPEPKGTDIRLVVILAVVLAITGLICSQNLWAFVLVSRFLLNQ